MSRGALEHQAAHRLPAGEENHVIPLLEQGGILFAPAFDHSDKARVKALFDHAGEKRGARGRIGRRLENGRISRRQRSGKGLQRQQEGVVPRAHDKRDAKGCAQNARARWKLGQRRFHALRRRELWKFLEEATQLAKHKTDLGEIGLVRRLVQVERKRLRNVGLVQRDGVAQGEQRLLTRMQRQRGPALKVGALGGNQKGKFHIAPPLK